MYIDYVADLLYFLLLQLVHSGLDRSRAHTMKKCQQLGIIHQCAFEAQHVARIEMKNVLKTSLLCLPQPPKTACWGNLNSKQFVLLRIHF